MRIRGSGDDYRLTKVIVKPLYFGLGVNIAIPGVMLMICYYLNNRGLIGNQVGDFANGLFYVFAAISVATAGFSVWWFRVSVRRPMIRRRETFDSDLMEQLVKRSRPVFMLIASIAAWGVLYFALTGRFNEMVFFVVFSFLVFQLVRPRYGSMRRIVDHQERLAEDKQFLTD